jgi:hypothetical protein
MDHPDEARSVLISTRLSADLARAAKAEADRELITVAAFARRAIAAAVRGRHERTAHAA